MNLAVIGFILIFVLMFILIKNRLSPPIAFILLPLIAAVAGRFGTEAIGGSVKTGLNTMLSTAVLFILSISYFTLISNEGLFDPIIHFSIKRMGSSVTTVLLAVVITTFMAHPDGSDTTTFLIMVPVFLPICKRLKVRSEALLGTIRGICGVMDTVPWGDPTMHAASVIGIEVSDLYRFIMPSVATLAVIAFGVTFVIARIEMHNGAGADRDGAAADEKGADEGTAKRKKLYRLNLGFTVLVLALLFVDIGLPLHLISIIAFCIALTVDHPDMAGQTKQFRSYAASAMIMTMTPFSVGIFMGVIKDSGMVKVMAATIVGILPAGVAPHMHWSMALSTVPLVVILGADAFCYALMPVILDMVEQFEISLEVVAAAFLLAATLSTPISPSVAAAYVGLDLADNTVNKHVKYSLRILWPVSVPLLVVSTLIGIIRF